ncbi:MULTISPECIES: ABC transporter ATP-binding protein [Microbacterium]|uniref:ABC transporter ATP-binding protein n=1 Tax=Microbacterium TaxID=33882 RepID=UPI00146C6AF7|nr:MULTISPECIES: ABC transporter ATP-binding protein [Microbacterium]
MAIRVEGLTKRFRTTTAVNDLTFSVPEASVFAFLGANGAGKSTTINCLTSVLAFDAGTVRVADHDVVTQGERVRERIGVVFQDSVLDPMLTVRENLRLRATLAKVPRARADRRIAHLAELIEVDTFLDRRYGALSGGQRRRVDIARALVHEPAILFLDEPTAGLDPRSRALLWRTVHGLRRETGLTVFLTTHYMEETEEADRVCIIDRGEIVADGTPAALRAEHSHSILTVTTSDVAGLARLASIHGGEVAVDGDVVVIAVPDAAAAQGLLATHGDKVRDFEFRHGRMDDVFLALTGRIVDDDEPQPGARS